LSELEQNGHSTILFRLGLLSALMTLLLYLIAPQDPSEGMPSGYASRYLWTPAIPFFIGSAICLFVLSGFKSNLDKQRTNTAAVLIPILIVLSPQLAELSPIESDGWWFLQIGLRFTEFGNDGTQSYLSHMLVLLPMDLVSKIIPNKEPLIAAILGSLFFVGWLLLSTREILRDNVNRSFTLPVFVLFSLVLVSWWTPTPYSAQMLAMLLMSFLLFTNPGNETPWWLYFAVAILVPLAHIQISIVICLSMIIDGAISVTRSRTSIFTGFLVGLSFFCWNFTGGEGPFMAQFPDNTPFPIRFDIFISALALACLISAYLNSAMTKNKSSSTYALLEKIDHRLGTANIALVFGCILFLPLAAYIDFRINAARLTPRLIVYCIVPVIFWLSKFSELTFETLKNNTETKRLLGFVFLMTALICGSLASIGHVNYVQRTVIIPDESLYCWDMAEESGIRGLMSDSNPNSEANFIIHSPMFLSPADDHNFWYFYPLGDESQLPNRPVEVFSAVLESADMEDKDWTDLGLDPDVYENWTLVGEVPGACRLWVNPADVASLDPGLYWDRR
jgi:hypothetical protein